jgi:hypothetical protein
LVGEPVDYAYMQASSDPEPTSQLATDQQFWHKNVTAISNSCWSCPLIAIFVHHELQEMLQ